MGQEAGVGDHAVVRPHGHALDMPGAVEHLDGLGHVERAGLECVPQLHHLHDARGVGEQDPSGMERLDGMGHDTPGLGKVQHHAVEVGLVDALVAVP